MFGTDAEAAPESAANARLIAAAPDLLAALREGLYWCEQDRDNEDGHPSQAMLEARCERLASAIAKAEGGAHA